MAEDDHRIAVRHDLEQGGIEQSAGDVVHDRRTGGERILGDHRLAGVDGEERRTLAARLPRQRDEDGQDARALDLGGQRALRPAASTRRRCR